MNFAHIRTATSAEAVRQNGLRLIKPTDAGHQRRCEPNEPRVVEVVGRAGFPAAGSMEAQRPAILPVPALMTSASMVDIR
jgi:hypothetical protein